MKTAWSISVTSVGIGLAVGPILMKGTSSISHWGACLSFLSPALLLAVVTFMWLYKRTDRDWTVWLRAAGILAYVLGLTPILIWTAWPVANAEMLPPSINGNGNCINIGPSQGPQTNNCSTIVNPPPPRNPSMLYLPNGEQVGNVSGIHPSSDMTTVKFDRINVPDNFPWGGIVKIQHVTISCEKPSGGDSGRIEGFGLPINSYWTVTCKVLGPA